MIDMGDDTEIADVFHDAKIRKTTGRFTTERWNEGRRDEGRRDDLAVTLEG